MATMTTVIIKQYSILHTKRQTVKTGRWTENHGF